MKTLKSATKNFNGPAHEGCLLRVQLVTYEVPESFFEAVKQRYLVESFWLRKGRLTRTIKRFHRRKDEFSPAAQAFNSAVKKYALDLDPKPHAP